jgi:hypothetical protein
MTKITTNVPTHETIAQHACEIWNARGTPTGCDDEIWLEAERQLTTDSSQAPHAGVIIAGKPAAEEKETAAAVSGAAGPVAGPPHPGGAPDPDDVAARAAVQKRAARAPQIRHGKDAPKASPTESGKPLWDKPHSS